MSARSASPSQRSAGIPPSNHPGATASPGHQHDASNGRVEDAGEAGPEAGTRAGDDRHLAVQPELRERIHASTVPTGMVTGSPPAGGEMQLDDRGYRRYWDEERETM